MRHQFGGNAAAAGEVDGVDGEDDLAQWSSGATVTFWNLQTGGTQYTDLLDRDGAATDHTTTSTGADGWGIGIILPVQGPDDVWEMYASVDGGARFRVSATDVGSSLGPTVASTASGLAAHIAATGADNPHATRVRDLADTNSAAVAAATDGQVLGLHAASGLWLPITIPGTSDVVRLTTTQVITGFKTFKPPTAADSAIRVEALTGQVGDVFACFSETGQRTGYFNEKGELRAIAAAANSVAFRAKGQTGQTANIIEVTDIDNTVLGWFDPAGRVRGPNINSGPSFGVLGTIAVGAGVQKFFNDTGQALTVRAVRVSLGTAPTGSSAIFDVNINGSSLFTSPNRPTIAAAGTTSGKVTAMSATNWPDGQALTFDVDQVGSTIAGADLTVQILAY